MNISEKTISEIEAVLGKETTARMLTAMADLDARAKAEGRAAKMLSPDDMSAGFRAYADYFSALGQKWLSEPKIGTKTATSQPGSLIEQLTIGQKVVPGESFSMVEHLTGVPSTTAPGQKTVTASEFERVQLLIATAAMLQIGEQALSVMIDQYGLDESEKIINLLSKPDFK